MSKTNNTEEIFNELVIFRRQFRDRQDVSDEIQTIISLIKDELQTSIEKVMSQNKTKKKYYGWIVTE